MFKSIILAIALAAGVLHAPAALAETTGRVAVGPLSFTLTDLDPNDGIAPSLVFDPMPYVPELWLGPARVGVYAFADTDRVEDFVPAAGDNAPLSASADLAGRVWGSATMGGRGQPGTHLIDLSVGLVEASGSDFLQRHVRASALAGIFYFELSPNSAVSFRLPVEFEAARVGGAEGRTSLTANALLNLVIMGSGIPEVWETAQLATANAWGDFVLDQQHLLLANHGNATNQPIRGFIIIAGSTEIYSVTGLAPVPEPSAASMLLAGLALAAAWARRRPRAKRLAARWCP